MEEVDIPLMESELVEPGRCKERVREVFSRLVREHIHITKARGGGIYFIVGCFCLFVCLFVCYIRWLLCFARL